MEIFEIDSLRSKDKLSIGGIMSRRKSDRNRKKREQSGIKGSVRHEWGSSAYAFVGQQFDFIL